MKNLFRYFRYGNKKLFRYRNNKEGLAELWSTKHIKNENWTKHYFDSWQRPYRYELVKRLKGYQFNNLIDLGCNTGPNLKALKEAGIIGELSGIDINEEAIAYGKKQFEQSGYDIHLEARSLYDIDITKKFDVVIATAVLQHIPPDAINQVLNSIFKIVKKRMILIDLHTFRPLAEDIKKHNKKYWDRWARDWWETLATYIPKEKVTISELPCGGAANIYDSNAIIDIQL